MQAIDTNTLEKFIARVESNAHADAIDEFYAEDASMQENMQPARVGRAHLVEHERAVLAKVKSLSSTCVRPIFVHGNRAVIRWVFEFEWLDGSHTRIEELAYQEWEANQIVRETFFYDPAQRKPLPRPTPPEDATPPSHGSAG
jgi:SnoaL-like domain